MFRKVTYGELQEEARRQRIDPEQSYEELCDALDVRKCKWCDNEYLTGYSDGYCSDGCEVAYFNEFFRND